MDNENDVAELLSLCGVCKTYHFESPMLHLSTLTNLVSVFFYCNFMLLPVFIRLNVGTETRTPKA